MCLQKSILKLYKETFPTHRLRETSENTGIQLTRLFRIHNGSEMKLKEYEAFERCLNQNDQASEFLKTSKHCLEKLTPHKRKLLHAQMKKALKIHFLKEAFHFPELQNNQFA